MPAIFAASANEASRGAHFDKKILQLGAERARACGRARLALAITVAAGVTDLQANGAPTQTVSVNTPVTVVTTCANNGPLAAVNASCTVTGIPASAASTSTGGAAATAGTTCTPATPVANFAIGAVITCTTKFTPTQPGTYLLPTAVSSDTPDSNPANDTAPSTVIVTGTQPSQPEAIPVPVGSRWMLVLLGLLFATAGMHGLRAPPRR